MAAEDKPREDMPERNRVEAELDAIFRSPEFERAPVMRQLLSFLVRTTLAGGGDELKAYTVAVEGLGRDPDFDSQSDSYPRVQVGRLRKMLDAYYAATPAEDGIRLHVRPGGYRVHFIPSEASGTAWRAPAWEPADNLVTKTLLADGMRRSAPLALPRQPFPWRLLIIGAVLLAAFLALIGIVRTASETRAPPRTASQAPVLELGAMNANGGADARMLAAASQTLLEAALHRSWLVRVRESNPTSARELSDADKPVYRLTGRVDTSGALGGRQIVLTLLDLQSGDQIWSQSTTVPPQGVTLTDAMRPAIVSLIAPFGVIATHQRGLVQPVGEPGYACILDFDTYFRYRDPGLRPRVRDCIRETVAREPLDPTALAAASFVALDPQLAAAHAPGLAEAADLARRAVAADPNSAEAQTADARVAVLNGQCVRGRELGLRAVTLNPYSPELGGMIGYLLIACNNAEGTALLQRAMAEDPDVPTFYGAALILALVEQGDTESAVHVADMIRPPGPGMSGQYEVTQTFAAAARGDATAARGHWAKARLAAQLPNGSVDAVLARYFYITGMRARMADFLKRSGAIQ
jgi:hypothetical protein